MESLLSGVYHATLPALGDLLCDRVPNLNYMQTHPEWNIDMCGFWGKISLYFGKTCLMLLYVSCMRKGAGRDTMYVREYIQVYICAREQMLCYRCRLLKEGLIFLCIISDSAIEQCYQLKINKIYNNDIRYISKRNMI